MYLIKNILFLIGQAGLHTFGGNGQKLHFSGTP